MKIYIVEDDPDIREMESYALTTSGYEVTGFADGSDFLAFCEAAPPDLIVLDIMLPKEDGLSLLRKLRTEKKTREIPIMMVSAKSTELDKVKGLDLGADDYLTKPFGIMELVSRVKALLRRAVSAEEESKLEYEDIQLDDTQHVVTVQNAPVELTYKEYELLKYFLANRNRVLSREKLMDKVWGFDYEGESRTVDMHIKTLRQKLGTSGAAIKTVRNVGYKLGD